jgi:hypothetical protein
VRLKLCYEDGEAHPSIRCNSQADKGEHTAVSGGLEYCAEFAVLLRTVVDEENILGGSETKLR